MTQQERSELRAEPQTFALSLVCLLHEVYQGDSVILIPRLSKVGTGSERGC